MIRPALLLLPLLLAGCGWFRAAPVPPDGVFRIARIAGAEVPDGPRPAELHLMPARFAATVGCNRLTGTTEAARDALRFGPVAATRMACLPPLDAREAALTTALGQVRRVRREGVNVTLLDEAGAPMLMLIRR